MREEKEKMKIARCFGKAAISYDQASNFQRVVGTELLAKMRQHVNNPQCILDVGAGTGFWGRILSQQYSNANIINLDMAFPMMQYAAKYKSGDRCQHVCADFDALPIRSRSVDIVFSNMVVQWSMNLKATLHEISQALKNHGVCAFSLPVEGTLCELSSCKDKVVGVGSAQLFYTKNFVRESVEGNTFKVLSFEVKKIVQYYTSIGELFAFLKLTGANYPRKEASSNMLRGKYYRRQLQEAYEVYRDKNGLLPATFYIAYVVVENIVN